MKLLFLQKANTLISAKIKYKESKIIAVKRQKITRKNLIAQITKYKYYANISKKVEFFQIHQHTIIS